MGVLDMGTRLPVELTHGATRSCGASGSRLLQQEAPWGPKPRPPWLSAKRIVPMSKTPIWGLPRQPTPSPHLVPLPLPWPFLSLPSLPRSSPCKTSLSLSLSCVRVCVSVFVIAGRRGTSNNRQKAGQAGCIDALNQIGVDAAVHELGGATADLSLGQNIERPPKAWSQSWCGVHGFGGAACPAFLPQVGRAGGTNTGQGKQAGVKY